MTPRQILIATNNPGKFHEISTLLKQVNIEPISAFDFNLPEPEETGKTFAANSLLKAKYYATKTGLTALADDSGLCIEALGGAPGITSARFAIDDETGKKDFPKAFAKIFSQLKAVGVNPEEKPRAHFICNLSLFNPQTNFAISFEGKIDGHLTFPARGVKGFGYDPIFIKNGLDKTFGEIDPEIKDKISHRAIAFEKFMKWLETSL